MKQKISLFIIGLLVLPMVAMAKDALKSAPVKNLDPKIVERRHCHVMDDVLNDALDLQFDQIIFEYTSVDPGLQNPVRLTASISMTPNVYSKEHDARALILYNEFTTAKHGERTSQNELADIGLYMNKYQDFILVAADLYGWTLTEDKPQAYCCPDATAVESLDAWDAAMMLLEQEGYKYEDLPIFNVGYSSGGFSAMAVQKYVDENRPDIVFQGTCAGGAPFDITTVYENYVKTNFTGYQCALPLMIVSYKETYGMDFEYSDVFQSPLADNIQEWILSKDYGTWDINGLIGVDKKVNEVLTPTACDYTQGLGRQVYMKFRNNSLCGPWARWQPSQETNFFIFHSTGDLYMHYHVGLEMADYLDQHGCNVTSEFVNWGNHVDYAIYSYIIQTMMFMENNMENGYTSQIQEAIENLKENLIELVESVLSRQKVGQDTPSSTPTAVDGVTADSPLKVSANDDNYYTISGEKLREKPERGIYIYRGVKRVAW